MRVSIVIDEFFGAEIALELRLGEEIRDEGVETLGRSVLLLAVWAVALLLEVRDHALVAEEVVALGALLSVFHDI